MSELVKTRAIVLRKINFGDSSRIAHFFTEDYGKMPVMIKGARSPKSKSGLIVDLINVVEIVLHKKETRELQISNQIDLLTHFPNIREDFEKYKYTSSIIEMLNSLLLENEPHKKLFSGTIKMFSLIDSTNESPKLLFIKYFLFLLKEIGYDFNLEICNTCSSVIKKGEDAFYNFEAGLLCSNCSKDRLTNFNLNSELLDFLFCLKTKKNGIPYKEEYLDVAIKILEKFLKYHVHEFKGIQSLKFG